MGTQIQQDEDNDKEEDSSSENSEEEKTTTPSVRGKAQTEDELGMWESEMIEID